MRRSLGLWIGAVLLALVLGGAIGARWWGQPTAPPTAAPVTPSPVTPSPATPSPATAPPPDVTETPFLRIEGTQLQGTDPQGRRVWELQAKTLEVDRLQQRIVMTSVTGAFYTAAGPQLTFAAPRAVYDTASKDVALSGGVVARARDGRAVRAAAMRYRAGTRVLTATGNVTLTQAGLLIRADELRTDAALAQPRFSGHIVVRVTE